MLEYLAVLKCTVTVHSYSVIGIYIHLFEKIDCRQTATTYKFLIYKHDIKRKLE